MTNDARVLALARAMALSQHCDAITGSWVYLSHEDDKREETAEELGFPTCPHPDCAAVRAAQAGGAQEESIDLDAIKGRLASVCYGYRWTDVLTLCDEIVRLRAGGARPSGVEPPAVSKEQP